MLVNKKVNQVNDFIYMGSIISKDCRCGRDGKKYINQGKNFFFFFFFTVKERLDK